MQFYLVRLHVWAHLVQVYRSYKMYNLKVAAKTVRAYYKFKLRNSTLLYIQEYREETVWYNGNDFFFLLERTTITF